MVPLRASSIFGGDEDSDLSDVDEADLLPRAGGSDAEDDAGADGGAAGDEYDEEDAAIEAEAEAEALRKEQQQEAAEDANDGDYTQQEKADANGLPSFRKDPNAPKKKRREPGAETGEDGRPKSVKCKINSQDMADPRAMQETRKEKDYSAR